MAGRSRLALRNHTAGQASSGTRAILVGVLTEMDDLIFQPGGKGPSYIRAGDLLTRSHANAISSLITSGIVQP